MSSFPVKPLKIPQIFTLVTHCFPRRPKWYPSLPSSEWLLYQPSKILVPHSVALKRISFVEVELNFQEGLAATKSYQFVIPLFGLFIRNTRGLPNRLGDTNTQVNPPVSFYDLLYHSSWAFLLKRQSAVRQFLATVSFKGIWAAIHSLNQCPIHYYKIQINNA